MDDGHQCGHEEDGTHGPRPLGSVLSLQENQGEDRHENHDHPDFHQISEPESVEPCICLARSGAESRDYRGEPSEPNRDLSQ